MASGKANRKMAEAAVELPECPVCLETMSAPIFQCKSGHSLCSECTKNLCPPKCPICREPMTQMRNWQLEDIISKAKVPCPNKPSGCVYTMAAADVEDHLKECIFRMMDCTLGAVFGRCSWNAVPVIEPGEKVIDLRSDTATQPSDVMKRAMVIAPLGDDTIGDDPTVNALEHKVAEMLGKQDALFVPTATMANLIAAMVHCKKKNSKMLCGDLSHIYKREANGISRIAGVYVATLKNFSDGTFNVTNMENHIKYSRNNKTESLIMMVAIENTHSFCGGKVLPIAWIERLAEITKKLNVPLHMDGARLFNAVEWSGEAPAKIARHCDSVSVCFSKGLGAPAGSALVGTKSFIDQARGFRKMLGGGMRQAGVLAACALVALDDSVLSFREDHLRTRCLASVIKELKSPTFIVDVQNLHTNIIHVNIDKKSKITSEEVVKRLASVGKTEITDNCKTKEECGIVVLGNAKVDNKTLRLVMHRDVTEEDLRLAAKKIIYVLKELDEKIGRSL